MARAPQHRTHPYRRAPDQQQSGQQGGAPHHPVVIAGAGPAGLVAALDLGLRGVPVLVLDEGEGIRGGSRAICFAKRTLEICDRLGAGRAMLEQGVVWNTGRVFHREDQVYQFDLLPEDGHRFPAFINLGQPAFERCLHDRLSALQAEGVPIDLRGGNRVAEVLPGPDGVTLTVETPDGPYEIRTDWLIAADGARSPIRNALGLGFRGRVFEDSFLIADVRMASGFSSERRFWFEPPFRSGASALIHKQPDNVFRLDFQIGWDVDREEELREPNVRARINRMLGDGVDYEIVWRSIYTFQCRRMERFRQGRVLFAGDAAHQLSPFGARGANSGVQDADNLGWKLAMVLDGTAPEALLDSYHDERAAAADENIRASTRSTDFITPKSPVSRMFRDAVLELAGRHAFARPMVNSGRLSVPMVYDRLPLTGEDWLPGGPAATRPGAACPDAAQPGGYLLDRLGDGFTMLALGDTADDVPETLELGPVTARRHAPEMGTDLHTRYLGATKGAVYLVRPDRHIAARWTGFDEKAMISALQRATGRMQ